MKHPDAPHRKPVKSTALVICRDPVVCSRYVRLLLPEPVVAVASRVPSPSRSASDEIWNVPKNASPAWVGTPDWPAMLNPPRFTNGKSVAAFDVGSSSL